MRKMMHFFERLQREIDFQKEYEKLETMISCELYSRPRWGSYTINTWIEENFRKWEKRGNYISFSEVRSQLGFEIDESNISDGRFARSGLMSDVSMEEYFLFGELLLNIFFDLYECEMSSDLRDGIGYIIDTLNSNIEKSGFEVKQIDDRYLIVEKDAVAIEVADYVPALSDVIVEYNHYLLRGNLTRKQELLRKITSSLEPKRNVLGSLNKSATDDFFWMVNKMNIRHNNCDPSDSGKYVPQFACLTAIEREEWYDKIYEQALMLYVLLKGNVRKQEIKAFKQVVEALN